MSNKTMYRIAFLLVFVSLSLPLFAQEVSDPQNHPDAQAVKKAMEELFKVCGNVDGNDPKVAELGPFYKADHYVVYRGPDKEREWKDFANYSNPDERKNVDGVCVRINETINRSESYRFSRFLMGKRGGMTWYVWQVFYKEKEGDEEIEAIFAFLKIGGDYALGDID